MLSPETSLVKLVFFFNSLKHTQLAKENPKVKWIPSLKIWKCEKCLPKVENVRGVSGFLRLT